MFEEEDALADIMFNEPPNMIDERDKGEFALGAQLSRSWHRLDILRDANGRRAQTRTRSERKINLIDLAGDEEHGLTILLPRSEARFRKHE
jgi:hypothetical protein